MKQYEIPEVKVDLFEVDDVLSTSETLEPIIPHNDDFTTPGDEFADE